MPKESKSIEYYGLGGGSKKGKGDQIRNTGVMGCENGYKGGRVSYTGGGLSIADNTSFEP